MHTSSKAAVRFANESNEYSRPFVSMTIAFDTIDIDLFSMLAMLVIGITNYGVQDGSNMRKRSAKRNIEHTNENNNKKQEEIGKEEKCDTRRVFKQI